VKSTWGSARFTSIQRVLLQIAHSDKWFTLSGSTDFYVLGRALPITDNMVDFTPYGAEESGVSRRHAMLTIDQEHLWITDLHSVNGTFLNGRQLEPDQATVLRDGDQVELARLSLRVYFTL
jgi:pSer/pThr/pTyr-binding forkhead associated (FHA) protein